VSSFVPVACYGYVARHRHINNQIEEFVRLLSCDLENTFLVIREVGKPIKCVYDRVKNV